MNKTNLILIVCLIGLGSLVSGQDQWNLRQEVTIRQGTHLDWHRQSATRTVGDLVGESAIVWSDCRSGDLGVYMQVFDEAGDPNYADNGILVVDGENHQKNPVIAPCTDGGWFVAWVDFNADTLGKIHYTKVNRNGDTVWGESGVGVPVCDNRFSEDVREIIPDEQNGFYILWTRPRDGDAVFVQHFLQDGRQDEDWDAEGLNVTAGDVDIHYKDCCVDGENGLFVVWRTQRNGDFPLVAQRINISGELLWEGGHGVNIIWDAPDEQYTKICYDGVGGFFAVWSDWGDENSRTDIFAQRLDSGGNRMWGENAGILCAAAHEQSLPDIISCEEGSAIVVWEDQRVDGETSDLFGMKISGTDGMERDWNLQHGVPIVVAEGNQRRFRLASDSAGGAIIVWEDDRFEVPPESDIRAQYVNADGEVQWDEDGIVVCGAANEEGDGLGNQSSPVVLPTDNQGCVCVWQDMLSGSRYLYSQQLNSDGDIQWEQNGVLLAQGMDGSATYSQIHSPGNGDFVVTWLDGRFGERRRVPYIQYCSTDPNRIMETEFERNGIPVITQLEEGTSEPISFLSENGSAIMVWEDHRRGQPHSIYAQKISSGGERLWGGTGIGCSNIELDTVSTYRACTDGGEGAFVVWSAQNGNNSDDIYVQHLAADGRRLLGDAGRLLTGNGVNESVEQIITDGDGGAVIAWIADDPEMDYDLWIQRIDSEGEKLWDDDREGYGKRLSNDYYDQHEAKLIRHQNGFVAVWTDGRDDEFGSSQDDIYGQFILPDGSDLWERDGYLICCEEYHQQSPAVTIDNHEFIWVVWEDNRYSADAFQRDIYLQIIDYHPNDRHRPQVLFEFDGIPVCQFQGEQCNPVIIHDGQNGVWIAWEDDRRDNRQRDIYATHLNSEAVPYAPWEEDGSIISIASHRQENPQFAFHSVNGDASAILLWEDKRCTQLEENVNIYCQLIADDLVSVPEFNEEPPSKFQLHNAYPNPFNSTTRIEYSLAGPALISLNLYNLNGQKIETLINGRSEAGVHSVMLNAGTLPSGLYFIKLEASNLEITRKIMLLK